MPSAIGIRVYRVYVTARGSAKTLDLADKRLPSRVSEFISEFIEEHASVIQNNTAERSWYFERRDDVDSGSTRGYVHYGTFGFESNFVDAKTKMKKFRRMTTDIEEIPLYYEFWCPSGQVGFAAFQSFQGRSCINLVMERMKDSFEKENIGFLLKFSKIMPGDVAKSAYFSAPVKKLRLIKRSYSGDVADQYFDNQSPEFIDFEVSMSARRKASLGTLGSFYKSLDGGDKRVVFYGGIEFPEAVADIRVGGRIRRVGILGWSRDAGVIDVTDAIERGADGHPTFDSLRREANEILKDFYQAIIGGKREN